MFKVPEILTFPLNRDYLIGKLLNYNLQIEGTNRLHNKHTPILLFQGRIQT